MATAPISGRASRNAPKTEPNRLSAPAVPAETISRIRAHSAPRKTNTASTIVNRHHSTSAAIIAIRHAEQQVVGDALGGELGVLLAGLGEQLVRVQRERDRRRRPCRARRPS